MSGIDIVMVYPDLLGVYGDRGNALALAHRAHVHGLDARVVPVPAGAAVPQGGDVYLLGGGEDASMLTAGRLLDDQPALARVLSAGRPCLAVCAGLQLLSREYAGPGGEVHRGLGVLDVVCRRLPGERAVGEVRLSATVTGWGEVTGFENHQGDALLGEGVQPLGRVEAGVGNGHGGAEGALALGVVATYLHGPVLARNPAIADHLLARATGLALDPIHEADVDRLRCERLAATRRRSRLHL